MSSAREVGGPLVVRRQLGDRLKIAREQANVRLEAAARHIECSTSKLSRTEHGQGIPKTLEVAALLDLYGIDGAKEPERLLLWTKEAKATAWWQPYLNAAPGDLGPYFRLRPRHLLSTVFVTSRSTGCFRRENTDAPKLLRDDELTDEERGERDKLFAELRHLRAAAADEIDQSAANVPRSGKTHRKRRIKRTGLPPDALQREGETRPCKPLTRELTRPGWP